MAADRPMTHFRVMFSLALVMVAVTLTEPPETFTEALEKKMIDIIAESPEELLQKLDGRTIRKRRSSFAKARPQGLDVRCHGVNTFFESARPLDISSALAFSTRTSVPLTLS